MLVPKQQKNKKLLACSCGYKEESEEKIVIKEKTESAKSEEPKIKVVDPEQEEKQLPLTDAKCPECEHTKAYYWLVQTRAADEPETKFLKCEKCKHQWRDYS